MPMTAHVNPLADGSAAEGLRLSLGGQTPGPVVTS